MTELVEVELRDRILDIELNRPDKKNAPTADMYQSLVAAFHLGNSEARACDPGVNRRDNGPPWKPAVNGGLSWSHIA